MPDEMRVDTIVLHVDENIPLTPTASKHKKEDCVVVLKEKYFLDNIDQYLGIFEQYAKGEMSTYDFHGYIAGAGKAVSWALDRSLTYGVSLFNAAYSLADEMKENIKNGVANTLDNLKTKFRIEGKDFTYKRLSEIQKTGNYIQTMIGGNSPCGYEDYMRMGMARVYAYKPELKLTETQAELLSTAAERRINQRLEENRKWMNIAALEEQNSRWKGYYIGGSVAVASNAHIISETMKAFSEMDPFDNNSIEKAVLRYQELLKPWNERCAKYIATQLPGYARGYVQEKAIDSRKAFYSYWNYNPLSAF
ncbi:MAG TPA: hypothetical protein DDY31_00695 [Lachnospiraceae bacterium]|nr:hypothetical protein [Lachnospiraceae bacterium]